MRVHVRSVPRPLKSTQPNSPERHVGQSARGGKDTSPQPAQRLAAIRPVFSRSANAATFVCAQLLQIQFVKLAGGAVIIWIAIKLLGMQSEGGEEAHGKEAASVLQALWIILVADISMSINNKQAVAGACDGNIFLLLFGLVLSIPLVVCGAGLLSMLMDRYPIIVWIGAALLGKVGGEMMITDPWVHGILHPSKAVEYGVMGFFVVAVLVVSRMLRARKAARSAKNGTVPASAAD